MGGMLLFRCRRRRVEGLTRPMTAFHPVLKFKLRYDLAFSIFPRLGKMLYLGFETFVLEPRHATSACERHSARKFAASGTLRSRPGATQTRGARNPRRLPAGIRPRPGRHSRSDRRRAHCGIVADPLRAHGAIAFHIPARRRRGNGT